MQAHYVKNPGGNEVIRRMALRRIGTINEINTVAHDNKERDHCRLKNCTASCFSFPISQIFHTTSISPAMSEDDIPGACFDNEQWKRPSSQSATTVVASPATSVPPPPVGDSASNSVHFPSAIPWRSRTRRATIRFLYLKRELFGIVRSLRIESTLDTPAKIIGSLKIFAYHFRLGRQEDAHEFLRYVIDACHTTCLRLKKLQQQRRKYVSNGGGHTFNGSTVVKEIFGGALQIYRAWWLMRKWILVLMC
ncbi:hypothetical protein L2E82_15907 [Cichorium intybus]|uniref:Uncharacterized protein n=1 Tax=Cichorium intybus TaxID=13427 RepID=A0ACB9F4I9_CICIN|nr:hypothetical protein L2E82_15907 [Cichorium intybus]